MALRSLHEVLDSVPNTARGRGRGMLDFQSRDGKGSFPHLQTAPKAHTLSRRWEKLKQAARCLGSEPAGGALEATVT